MRIWKRVGLVVAVAGVVAALSASGATTFCTHVYAATPYWQSTGIWLNAGDTIVISARGCVAYWTCHACGSARYCGPNGTGGFAYEPCYLAPRCRRNALVGSIRMWNGAHRYFDVGSCRTLTASVSGYLCLGMNDSVHNGGSYNNHGAWDVSFTIYRRY